MDPEEVHSMTDQPAVDLPTQQMRVDIIGIIIIIAGNASRIYADNRRFKHRTNNPSNCVY
jgi:hypothetical protein